MALRLKRFDDTPVDVFEAIKRALIKRGFVRRRGARRDGPRQPSDNAQSADSQDENKTMNATLKPADGVAIVMPEEDPEKLVTLAENSQEKLIEVSTVFPFTLFPDTVSMDREKLTIAKRLFFRAAVINSTPITDIQSVEVSVDLFFGTVRITSKYFVNNQREIRFLRREDANKLHRVLQGLILAHQRQVDINTFDNEQLVVLLNDLGQGASD